MLEPLTYMYVLMDAGCWVGLEGSVWLAIVVLFISSDWVKWVPLKPSVGPYMSLPDYFSGAMARATVMHD